MNRGKTARRWLVIAVAVVLAGFAGWMRFAPKPAPAGNLAGASIGGPFQLTDQNGRKVRDSDFAGRWRLMYFGYSFCPDICPTDLALLGRGLKAFEAEAPARAARVVPIFVTIDPRRDTPAALRPFVAAFHPRLIGLTGTEDQIAGVTRAYGVYAKRMPSQDNANYFMDHSAMVYLFGPDGQPIAFLPHEGLCAEAITRMLETHVR